MKSPNVRRHDAYSFLNFLIKNKSELSPKFMKNQWQPDYPPFFEDGGIHLDNNAIENKIRPLTQRGLL